MSLHEDFPLTELMVEPPVRLPAVRPAASSLRDSLTMFFYDRRRILAVLLAGLSLTLLASMAAPKKYSAEAELLLRLGREYIYKPEVGEANSGAPVAYDREQTLLAEAKILTSRDLEEAVLDKLGPEKVYPELVEPAWRRWLRQSALPALGLSESFPSLGAPNLDNRAVRAAALMNFERSLDADLLKGSNLMQVSFVHRDPEVAAEVLKQVIDTYLERRSTIFASAVRGTAQANFAAREAQLKAADARLEALKQQRRIRAFGEEQNLLLTQRNSLEERQNEASLAVARTSGRAASLRSSLETVRSDVQLSSETQRSDAVEKVRAQLLDLRLKERDLTSQFFDDHPAVQDVRADIERANQYLKELQSNPVRTVRTGRNPARDVVESELVRTLAEQQQAMSSAATLKAQRESMERRLQEFATSESELHVLERERRQAEENYDAAAKQLRDENALAELDRTRRSNVSVVQAPRVPVTSKSIGGLVLVVGGMLSLCAALLTAFLSALWRDTFLTPQQVEQGLGVPLLVAVPEGQR